MGKRVMTMIMFLFIIVPVTVFADESEPSEDIESEEIELINEEVPVGDAFESDDFAVIEELNAEWEKNGYPDFVGHVYYDQDINKFKLGLVDMEDPEAEELIASLEDLDSIEIETAAFAYNDLLEIQESISEDLAKSSNDVEGINGVAVGWTTIDGKVSGFGDSGKEFRVVVIVEEGVYDEYKEKFASAYGDKVYVEQGGFETFEDDSATEDIQQISAQNNQLWIYLSLFALVCSIIIFLFIKRQKQSLMKQTTSGHAVSSSQPLSKKEVVDSVKKETVQPSDEVYEKIISKIEKNK